MPLVQINFYVIGYFMSLVLCIGATKCF